MDEKPAFLDLPKAYSAKGEISLPGSKSISNRVLLLAALAKGTTRIEGLLNSDDTQVMLAALKKLGVGITQCAADTYEVEGIDAAHTQAFPQWSADIFLGNAGTAFRPLTAALSVLGGDYYLHGVPRMHERPIKDLVEALQSFGCTITYKENHGYPPLHIQSPRIKCSDMIEIEGSVSSQFLTALLMVSPLIAQKIHKDVVIKVKGELISKPYIAITLNLMEKFGVVVERNNWNHFVIAKQACYVAVPTLWVEGDASSASYFLALGLIGQGPIRVHGVGEQSIQGDIQFTDVLEQMGATVLKRAASIEVSRPHALPLTSFDLDFNLIPDAAMTAAVLALYADAPCTLRNIASWRVKETDRIDAMHKELEKLGAWVESGHDWLRITPPRTIKLASIDTYDDHRMAMCFSLAVFGGVGVRIMDPQCVAKTFPTYFQCYRELVL